MTVASPYTVTVVEAALARRRRWSTPLGVLLGLFLLAGGILLALGAVVGLRYGLQRESAPYHVSDVEHFKYGSIGSEGHSGLPYWVWQVLPRMFPEQFGGRLDYAAFGFLYERDAEGRQRDLPIGISRRHYRGVDMVWFNCAVCHTGTWRPDAQTPEANLVVGMPSNNLDLGRFVRFLLGTAAADGRVTETFFDQARQAGAEFGPLERLVWSYVVLPRVREGLMQRRTRLLALIEEQPAWGAGRVDTFNPYKVIQFGIPAHGLIPEERVGTSDFPSIFLQAPRQGMQLHWDGNNTSLMERNLSAAIGAGVTPDSVDINSVKRIAAWLQDLPPPPSPARRAGAADDPQLARGQEIYMRDCAACHGHQDRETGRYEFPRTGRLGHVTRLSDIGTDRNRLDSFRLKHPNRASLPELQSRLFRGTRNAAYSLDHFTITDGYSNQPLDGLWLRGPYLHNGSVPTLRALLDPPDQRPAAFLRGLDIVDHANGGFLSPACTPSAEAEHAAPRAPVNPASASAAGRPWVRCFDTRQRGNGNGGHLYGTGLGQDEKGALLAYLRTF